MSEYDDEEWLDGDGTDANYESEQEGLVHPLPAGHQEKLLAAVEDLKSLSNAPSTTVFSATSESDDGSSEDEFNQDRVKVCVPCNDHVGTTYPDEIVRLHARRVDLLARPVLNDTVFSPPPAPVASTIVDIGSEGSAEAQKRIAVYRRRMAQQEEEQKNEKARAAHAAKQVRTMYKDFNRTIGVADIPPDQRYKEAVHEKHASKRQKEQAATKETAARWYRKVHRPTRSACNAADFGAKIVEEARRDHHAQLRAKELHRRAINKKLQQLSVEAKSIIAQNVGGCERGSYVLKAVQVYQKR